MEFPYQHRTSLLILPVLGWILAGWIAPLTGAPSGRLVDRVAAAIEDDVVTLTDLNWFIRFRGFQLPEDPAGREELLKEVLDQLINQMVVFRESEKTPFVQVTPEDLDRFLGQYTARFAGEEGLAEELRRLGFGMAELREMLRRQLAVNKFVELRFEPFVIVLPDEIEEFYGETYSRELEAEGQPAPPLELVQETIREILTVQKTTEQLEAWLQGAKRRYAIRVLLFRTPSYGPNLPAPYLSEVEMVDEPFTSTPSSSPRSTSPDRN